jgi:hypothetical protein
MGVPWNAYRNLVIKYKGEKNLQGVDIFRKVVLNWMLQRIVRVWNKFIWFGRMIVSGDGKELPVFMMGGEYVEQTKHY